MTSPLDILDDDARAKARRTDQPRWTSPMLAALTDERFTDSAWIFERKLDGERALLFRHGRATRLRSRSDKPLNDTYPEIIDALEDQPPTDAILDGEIVAFEKRRTSFSRLQQRLKITDPEEARASSVAVYYYLFDVLHLDAHDVTKVPLRDRKRLLRHVLDFYDPLRFTPHRNTEGEKLYEQACRKGWEGLIAKRADSPYAHARSRDWLKLKCVNRQELVIGGYTDPEGEREHFGAIVVGFNDAGDLVCAGKVGTGFDDQTLADLGERMRSRARKTSPFDRGQQPHGKIHWITPDLVCEVAFTEWTDDDRLRHPRFLGLRRDKKPEDVVKETPA